MANDSKTFKSNYSKQSNTSTVIIVKIFFKKNGIVRCQEYDKLLTIYNTFKSLKIRTNPQVLLCIREA